MYIFSFQQRSISECWCEQTGWFGERAGWGRKGVDGNGPTRSVQSVRDGQRQDPAVSGPVRGRFSLFEKGGGQYTRNQRISTWWVL